MTWNTIYVKLQKLFILKDFSGEKKYFKYQNILKKKSLNILKYPYTFDSD